MTALPLSAYALDRLPPNVLLVGTGLAGEPFAATKRASGKWDTTARTRDATAQDVWDLCDPATLVAFSPAAPPPGWFALGTHQDHPGKVALSGYGDDGMPRWERPLQPATNSGFTPSQYPTLPTEKG